MHPGFFGWWKRGRGECGPSEGCHPGAHEHGHRGWGRGAWGHHEGPHGGPHGHPHGHGQWAGHGPGGDEGGFGVRRPLRFFAWKLELNEAQVNELAAVLDALKIERAQAAVDQRRTTSALADTLEGGDFDAAKAAEATTERTKSGERVQAAVLTALGKMHALLDEEQRKRLAYLLRTGQVSI